MISMSVSGIAHFFVWLLAVAGAAAIALALMLASPLRRRRRSLRSTRAR
jgi:heme exporter protein D